MMALVTGHLRAAWSAYRANWRTFLAGMLALIGSWLGLEAAVVVTMRLGVIAWLALHVAFLVIFSGLLVGMNRMALEAIDGRTPTLRDLPESIRDGPTLLLAASIHALAIALGLVLLVVPGVYVSVRWSLHPQVIAARRVSVAGALRDAARLTRHSWWRIFRMQLVLIALNVCGAALLGVGLLVTFPVSILAAASLYRDLEANAWGPAQESNLVRSI
jgi:uncharacterized membrane protein